jgi:uncharacterized cofD-like protein
MRPTAQSAVALGGGHGLHASLSALRRLHDDLTLDQVTGVVTVADNGGSSGRLRGEFGVLPPGDLRMALAALCGDDEWGRTWVDVVQHRFAGDGDMRGHVIGNLLIVGLWELMGDHVRALDWVGRLLGARGRVLPMALTPMDITAEVSGLDPQRPGGTTMVRGQVEVATTPGQIVSIALDPHDPQACPEAVQAVLAADWVVLGPGSWFTSVIPHLMVPELRRALEETTARLLVVLNLGQQSETRGYRPADHLGALSKHAPALRIDTVLAEARTVGHDAEGLRLAVAATGADLLLAEVAESDGAGRLTARHDHELLAAAYRSVFEDAGSRRGRGD